MVKSCNTLLLSAGRRKRLHDFIEDYYRVHDINGKIFVTDSNPELSAVCMSDSNYVKILPANNPNYLDNLTQIISDNDINIIIPTIDHELLHLSMLQNNLHHQPLLPIISSTDFVRTFSSKTATHDFFNSNAILTPQIINTPTKNDLPLFAKLNHSSSSIGAQIVTQNDQLQSLLNSSSDYVFQEYVKGTEFTIDFFIDINQKLLATVPRQRLEVRAGEVSKALTIYDEALIKATTLAIKKLTGAYGPLCIQAIKNDQGIFFIEINTRFGGGYPLTHQAGVNFIEFIFNDYFKLPNQKISNWSKNLLMLRYDHEVIVNDYSI